MSNFGFAIGKVRCTSIRAGIGLCEEISAKNWSAVNLGRIFRKGELGFRCKGAWKIAELRQICYQPAGGNGGNVTVSDRSEVRELIGSACGIQLSYRERQKVGGPVSAARGRTARRIPRKINRLKGTVADLPRL
jgi:hypothetical protein